MDLFLYEDKYKDYIEGYFLTVEQLKYTGTPKQSVELSKVDPDRHSILAIDNDELVSYFVLHENEGVKPYTENNKAMLLRTFSTDFRHQGKGYAKKALLLLPNFVRKQFPHINEIVLAVNIKNVAAQTLYKKCSYIDKGVRKMGKKGELMILSLDLL